MPTIKGFAQKRKEQLMLNETYSMIFNN